MSLLKTLKMSGEEVLPLVEGGKGIAISNGESAGAWAAAGGVGTFSAVNADTYDENGNVIPMLYHSRTRSERHRELIEYSIKGGITQAQIAHETAGGQGRLHMNVLWEMAAVEEILHGVLEKAKDIVHGITCGAGMPYRVAEIAAKYNLHYYPIVSSARAFRVLWKRAYNKFSELLGGVVYEDPWRAGGHNGISNSDDPLTPEDPLPRVRSLREIMNSFGLHNVPIIMAGGVWYLRDWTDWINNRELGPIAFQFGSRPLLTQESPISDAWKAKLLTLKKGDISLNRHSPTGFYSSAVNNVFLQELDERKDRQISYQTKQTSDFTEALPIGPRQRIVYVSKKDHARATQWITQGFTQAMRTPDHTLIFVTPEDEQEIHKDQVDCMGCLSACLFSNWSQEEGGTTGRKADPRSFCIQKTLQAIGHDGDVNTQLMFAGHGAYEFGQDPFYANGFIPTVKQLVERLQTGD
ncbi:MAG: nitronate monooxygenase [Pseudomonadota bacterium]